MILASKREVKSGAQMWHVYRLNENTKSEEFYFAEDKPQSALKYAFLLRKRHGAIIPKAIFAKLSAAVSESKAQAEQESAPEAAEPSTAQAVQEVEQAQYFAQFKSIKDKHADAIVLFRVGEEYRTFGDDCAAMQAAIGRDRFEAEALSSFLPVLVRKGHRVAICDEENLKK